MTTSRWTRWLAVTLTVATLGVAACGDDEGSSSSAGSATNGAQPTGEPIKILAAGQEESVAVAAHPDFWLGAEAAAKALNDAGGIGGRPIEIVRCNDQGTPNGAAACGRRAVSEQVVSAISEGLFDGQFLAPLEQAQIPSINYPIPAEDFTSAMSFPLASDGILAIPALTIAAKNAGKKKLAIATLDNAAALGISKIVQSAAKSQGYADVPLVRFSAKTVDYAPIVQQLKQTGADAIIVATDLNSAIQLFKAANDAGLPATFGMNAASIPPERISELGPKGEGMLLTFDVPSPSLTADLPGLSTYIEQMEAADVPDDEASKTFALIGWLGVHAFGKVAGTVQGELTSASFLKALKQAKDVDLFGIIKYSPADPGPKSFPRLANGELRFGTIDGGKFKLTSPEPVDGWAEMGFRPAG